MKQVSPRRGILAREPRRLEGNWNENQAHWALHCGLWTSSAYGTSTATSWVQRLRRTGHGGVFMTLGDNCDRRVRPPTPQRAAGEPGGLFHRIRGGTTGAEGRLLRFADNEVPISHCVDHISQRSITCRPDGNRLEIYYEVPNALSLYPRAGRPGHAASR